MSPAVIALCILVLLIVLYVSRIVPAGAASLIGVILCILTGLTTIQEASVQFVSDVLLLQIGMMLMGHAFFKVGLAGDIGRLISRVFSGSEKLFLIIITLLAIFISSFISNAATVAMLLPIVASVSAISNGAIKNKHIYMAVGAAAVLGGNVTLFASTPQMAVQNILLESSLSGVRGLGVFELTLPALPLALLLPLYFALGGYRFEKKCFAKIEDVDLTEGETGEGQPKWKKICVGIIFILCIISFIGGWISLGATAILAALLCVVAGCVKEKEALKAVNWPTVVMLGGILAFSDAFSKSGAGELVVEFAVRLFGGEQANPLALYSTLIVIGVVLTSVMSNTAVAVMLTPIGILTAVTVGANPMTFAIGIILAASVCFATPIGTPPVAMTNVAGYRFGDYFKVGGLFTVFATIYLVFGVPLICGL